MTHFTSQNENPTFISSNSDLQEIWLMRNNVKKQLKDVEEKLEAARKTVYLPSVHDEDESISSFRNGENYHSRRTYSRKSPPEHFYSQKGSYEDEITPKRNRVETQKQRILPKRNLHSYDVPEEYREGIRNEITFDENHSMTINEQAKFYTVQDFLRRDSYPLKPPSSSTKSTKDIVFDDLSDKLREIKSQTGAIRREIAQNLFETSIKDAQTKPRTPRIESTNNADSNLNIDKNHVEPIRTPRIYSYSNVPKAQIRKIEHASDRRRDGRSSSENLARVEKIRHKYSSQESGEENSKNETKRSASSHESISITGQKQSSIESTTSASSMTTADSVGSNQSKPSGNDKNARKQSVNAEILSKQSHSSSTTTSIASSVNNKSHNLPNVGGESLPLDKLETKLPVKVKKKAASLALTDGDKPSQIKIRSYDADEIRRFMSKQKKDRKLNAEAPKPSGSIEKVRHYDQDLVKEYVKQQKFHRKSESQRAKEKMERAKILQNEKMKQVLDEQRSVRNVPLIQLILNANSFDKRPLTDKNLSKDVLVNLVREKYKDSFHEDFSRHSSEIQIVNGSKRLNDASADDDDEFIVAPASMRDVNGLYRNLPTTSFNVDNDTGKRLINEERVQIYETPKVRRSNDVDLNSVDEYNIVNTILRKHPELRISSSTRNEVKEKLVNDQIVRPNRVPRLDLSNNHEQNEIFPKHEASSSATILPKRNSDRLSFFANGRVSSSENVESRPSIRSVSPSVSTLTLSTGRSSPRYKSNSDLHRQSPVENLHRQSPVGDLHRQSLNEREITPIKQIVDTSSERSSSIDRSESEDRISPAALQMQVTAGLNYLNFVQDSIQQVAAVDRMSFVSTSHRNSSAFSHLVQTEHSNQQLHKDLQQVRLNTERQRITLEAEKIMAEERRQLAVEMNESQRRLMETILDTNQRMTDYRERNSEMLAKLATEVATTAATSAVLAAFKQQRVSLSPPERFSRSIEATTLSSSSTQTSSMSSEINETKSSRKSPGGKNRSEDEQNSFLSHTSIADEAKSNASMSPTIADEAKTNSPSVETSINTVSNEGQTGLSSKQTVANEAKTASSSTQTSIATVADEAKPNSTSTQTAGASVADEAKSVSSSTQTSVADEAKLNSSSTQTLVSTVADQAKINSSSTQTSVATTAVDSSRSNSSIVDEAVSINETSTFKEKTEKSSRSVLTKTKSSSVVDKKRNVDNISSETTNHSSTSNVNGTKNKSSKSSSDSSASEKESESLLSKKESKPGGKTSKILHEFLRQYGSQNEEIPLSPSSLSISDMTEMESRIQALKTDLKERKEIAEKLKHEYKRRTREGFKVTERSLTKQIQNYNEFIDQARMQLKDLERVNVSTTRSSTPPKIMSPRNSDSDAQSTPHSPIKRLKSAISSPRSSSSTSRANSEEKTLRESSTHEEKSANASTVVTEKIRGEQILLNEKNAIDENKTESVSERKSSKSGGIIVPPLNINETNVDDEALKPVIVSSRKPSVDVETTEEVSDVPEDIEDEIVVESEKTKTSSDSKPNGDYSEDIVTPSVQGNSTPKEDDSGKSEKSSLPKTNPPSENNDAISTAVVDEPKKLPFESNSQQKERLLASVLNSFVAQGVTECLDLWKLKKDKLRNDAVEEKSQKSVVAEPDFVENVVPKFSEDRISFENDPVERLSNQIFDEFLADAVGSCARIAISKRELLGSVGILSRKELGRVLELTKPNTPPDRTPTSSNEQSPRSPRSPSLDKYVSEIYREPNQNRVHGSEKSPRSSEKIDVPPLDTDDIFNDEAWMDDDFGLGESSDDIASPKKKSSPKSPKIDLSKFTTDVFSAVPCTITQIREVVDSCVEKIYDQRRFGEPMADAEKPKNLFAVGRSSDDGLDLSVNRDSDAAYKDFLFDYCKEIVCGIYSKETSTNVTGEYPIWKKPERLKLSQYSKIPPKNVDELKIIVNNIVSERLNLEPSTKKGREKLVARKKLDNIDEVLLPEMYREEPDWTNYDEEELKVKFELADSIWKTLFDEGISSQISNFTKRMLSK